MPTAARLGRNAASLEFHSIPPNHQKGDAPYLQAGALRRWNNPKFRANGRHKVDRWADHPSSQGWQTERNRREELEGAVTAVTFAIDHARAQFRQRGAGIRSEQRLRTTFFILRGLREASQVSLSGCTFLWLVWELSK